MSTRQPIINIKRKSPKLLQIQLFCSNAIFLLGTQGRVQIAVVNELSVFEPSKFYCIIKLSFKLSYGSSDWFETSVVADAYEKLNPS